VGPRQARKADSVQLHRFLQSHDKNEVVEYAAARFVPELPKRTRPRINRAIPGEKSDTCGQSIKMPRTVANRLSYSPSGIREKPL
jgi:hypothetical protein